MGSCAGQYQVKYFLHFKLCLYLEMYAFLGEETWKTAKAELYKSKVSLNYLRIETQHKVECLFK